MVNQPIRLLSRNNLLKTVIVFKRLPGVMPGFFLARFARFKGIAVTKLPQQCLGSALRPAFKAGRVRMT